MAKGNAKSSNGAAPTGLVGNAVFAQSGGPTAVINSSMAGGVLEALKSKKLIKTVYGAKNGILGVLQEELFDFGKEKLEDVKGLRETPAAAAGSCRYKVKTEADYARIIEVFQAHNIRYFFYAGGNDSMDTADKVARLARDRKYEMCVMGIPKTIDNDLAHTDHCPGFGSVAKYNATMIMEAGKDTEALYTTDTTTVQEVMGRNAGWIAASSGLAARDGEDAPHLIYVPEIPVSLNTMASQVKDCLKRIGRCFVVVCEGCKNEKGEYLSEVGGAFGKDAFGHKQLGGVGEFVANFIEQEIGVKARRNKPGTLQRAGMHWASKTDVDEAFMCGQQAVREALRGTTGHMVTLVRKSNNPYSCTTGLAKLSDVANGESMLPRDFLNEAGTGISKKFRTYLAPLVRGEVKIKMGADGLPVYVRLKRKLIAKKCGEWKK
ncbi:MAG TPA: 6-phosphofructokinase [Planctomycetota bacterium]|nr:6-phosphofructokinase [Planctomycetota bacterium]